MKHQLVRGCTVLAIGFWSFAVIAPLSRVLVRPQRDRGEGLV